MTAPGQDASAPGELQPPVGEVRQPDYPRPRRWRRVAARTPWRLVAGVATVGALAFLGGVLTARSTQAPPNAGAAATLERDVLPLVREADTLWTGDGGDTPAVAPAVADVRETGDLSAVTEHAASWLQAYDRLLASMAAVDVPPEGRAVQRQFIGGLALSRDAVDALAQAAQVESTGTRRLLVAEAIRLRSRSEFFSQSARTSLNALSDPARETQEQNTGVPPSLPSFEELLAPPGSESEPEPS